MSSLNTVLNELLQIVPRYKFDSLVSEYKNDRYVKYYTTWQQFITLLYAQIKGKDSLREIITSLNTHKTSWYHMGLKDIHRSTISDANRNRSYEVYEKLFYEILKKTKDITPKHKFRFDNPMYSIDATVINLCLSMFPWARYRKTKGALKLHYQYDHSGAIPSFMVVTDAKQHEAKVVKQEEFPLLADSIVSVDRGYIDYKWLNSLNKKRVFFVTRTKSNIKYEVIGQQEVDGKKGLEFDQTIRLTGYYTNKEYPEQLRLVGYKDPKTDKELVFLTNNFKLSAFTITQIYKSRWQIELFFKWIKQNLKIKSFLGTNKNAVLSQIWVAMCYYLLLAYIKYQTKYGSSLTELTRIFSEAVFLKVSIIDLLSIHQNNLYKLHNLDKSEPQLTLF
jgi:hypothetical protein